MSVDAKPVKLLWTGGWDSTYQLLVLLFKDRRVVQPYFLEDPGRASTPVEIRAMGRIRERLIALDPSVEGRLLPLYRRGVAGLPPSPRVSEAFRALRRRGEGLGGQYDWLARFCLTEGLHDLQLCIEKDTRAYRMLEGHATLVSEDGVESWRILPPASGDEADPLYVVFRDFRLPLLETTRADMIAAAKREGWFDVLSMTWFCHKPRRIFLVAGREIACGICNPCQHALHEGFAWRLPARARLLGHVYGFTAPLIAQAFGLLRPKRSSP